MLDISELTLLLPTLLGLSIAGTLIGIISSMTGIGGGLLAVPLLMYGLGLTNPIASAISSLVIVLTSSSGGYSYWRQKRIDLRTGFYFASIAIPMAFVGGIIADNADVYIITIFWGCFLSFVAVWKISSFLPGNRRKKAPSSPLEAPDVEDSAANNEARSLIPKNIETRTIIDAEGEGFTYMIRFRQVLLGAVLGGFLGGLFGVGGGVIYVPVLMWGGVPPHIAMATSTFAIVFASASGSTARILGGNVIYEYVLGLGIGTVIGANIGAMKARKVSSRGILAMFYAILLFTGIYTVAEALFKVKV